MHHERKEICGLGCPSPPAAPFTKPPAHGFPAGMLFRDCSGRGSMKSEMLFSSTSPGAYEIDFRTPLPPDFIYPPLGLY